MPLHRPCHTFYTNLGNTSCLSTTQFTEDCLSVELEPRLRQYAGFQITAHGDLHVTCRELSDCKDPQPELGQLT